ncbi:polyketide cyclase [Limnohabitans sp. Rim8]|uniref:SRPBCC domain-containing protein n=1 Tax=Limnohabitans sp. Rim8 TaxID=1100718 RepID=UPI000D352FDD|nr:SRPBCC domain-containing protein [Limnohabitans sp. Rim8]PUE57586.1 polyketide cyclase [Limnohabitans sp. Rim8]
MNHDSTFHTERTLPFSPKAVYNAFASADVLATWWGPDGFSNEFETFELQVGGRWTFVMVGPDGARYANQSVFTELEPASRVVIRHDCQPFFTLTVQLTQVADGTHLQWQQVFDDAHIAQAVKAIVEPANEQNLDRLMQALERFA